jgi:hypothetical protein
MARLGVQKLCAAQSFAPEVMQATKRPRGQLTAKVCYVFIVHAHFIFRAVWM